MPEISLILDIFASFNINTFKLFNGFKILIE